MDIILPIQQSEFNIPITLDAQADLLDIPGFYQKGSGNFRMAIHGCEVVGTIFNFRDKLMSSRHFANTAILSGGELLFAPNDP